MARMSGFQRNTRHVLAEGAAFCAHRTARGLLQEVRMKTTHVARAGLVLFVIGCGSGTLLSPDSGAAGTSGWETIGSAGTNGSKEYGCAGSWGSPGGAGGETGTAGTSGMTGSSGTCGSATTLAACDARTDCHPVFEDRQNCPCAAIGCCAMFSRCAEGESATCTGAAECSAVVDRPHCEGPYVVGFVAIDGNGRFGNGYEGCVRASDCPGPTGAAGSTGAAGTNGAAGTSGLGGDTGTASR